MIKIEVKPEEAALIIACVLGSSSFYVAFDKVVFEKQGNNIPINDAYELVKKISSQWNRNGTDTINFNEMLENEEFCKAFKKILKVRNAGFDESQKQIKNLLDMINCQGIQNTKISKLLYVYAPNLIPMIDTEQGSFILNGYQNDNRGHLYEVFEKIHKALLNNANKKKIEGIKRTLEEKYKIKLTNLRILELLIWIQVWCKNKDIDINLISNS